MKRLLFLPATVLFSLGCGEFGTVGHLAAVESEHYTYTSRDRSDIVIDQSTRLRLSSATQNDTGVKWVYGSPENRALGLFKWGDYLTYSGSGSNIYTIPANRVLAFEVGPLIQESDKVYAYLYAYKGPGQSAGVVTYTNLEDYPYKNMTLSELCTHSHEYVCTVSYDSSERSFKIRYHND